MKIIIIIPLFLPKWIGGAELATCNIAKLLVSHGNEVHILTKFYEDLPLTETKYGVFIHRIKMRNIKIFGVLAFWINAIKCIRKISPDIVQIQFIDWAIPGYLAKKIWGFPYFVWGRGADVYLPWYGKEMISYIVLKNANEVFALTKDMQKGMKILCPRDIHILTNGIDIREYENIKLYNPKKDINHWQIICVAMLRPLKGIHYLIEAMQYLIRWGYDIKLVIIGDGEERESLEKLVDNLDLKKYIEFKGIIPHNEVISHLGGSDLFVLPTLQEGFSNVILEGMAAGLPIVSSNIEAIKEIIKDGENGLLVEPKNPHHLAEKIKQLLDDDDLRNKIKSNNKKTVLNYSWETIVRNLEGYYTLHIKQ